MKICVFSDIHGNGPAFSVAYDMIIYEKADLNVFLGDLCGYYYDQLDIFFMLLEMPNLIAVLGNHDRIFLDIATGDNVLRKRYHQEFGISMDKLLKAESGDLVKWLRSLPESHRDTERKFSCFHGSPQNYLEGYVYQDSTINFYPESCGNYIFSGHTHYKMHRSMNGTSIINPGSLGQPRDGGEWPSYAIVNLSLRKVLFKEVVYNKDDLKSKIREVGEESRYLFHIIDRGHE